MQVAGWSAAALICHIAVAPPKVVARDELVNVGVLPTRSLQCAHIRLIQNTLKQHVRALIVIEFTMAFHEGQISWTYLCVAALTSLKGSPTGPLATHLIAIFWSGMLLMVVR